MIQVLWEFVVKASDVGRFEQAYVCDGWTESETELGTFDNTGA